MLVKVSELSGAALNFAVAKVKQPGYSDKRLIERIKDFQPSANWSQGGQIIDRERISLRFDRTGRSSHPWCADTLSRMVGGTTPLIAAMRCYVVSKLGDEIEVPDELL